MNRLLVLLLVVSISSIKAQDVTFTPTAETVEGMKEVKRLVDLGEVMSGVLSTTVFASLFDISQSSLEQVFYVGTNDWTSLVASFDSVNRIVRNSVDKHCDFMIYEHHKMKGNSSSEKKQIRSNLKYWEKFQESLR